MAPVTRNLADQLATIATKLDVILASLRDDVEEIKVQVNRDCCKSEESKDNLKNTVVEELQGSEHDPLQPFKSSVGGRITYQSDISGDGIEGTNEMDGGMHTGKIDGTAIEAWAPAKKLTAKGSHDRKRRGEISEIRGLRKDSDPPISLAARRQGNKSVLISSTYTHLKHNEFLRYGFDLPYLCPRILLFDLAPSETYQAALALAKHVVIIFIIVWDPGKGRAIRIQQPFISYLWNHLNIGPAFDLRSSRLSREDALIQTQILIRWVGGPWYRVKGAAA